MRLLLLLVVMACCVSCLNIEQKNPPSSTTPKVVLPDTLSFDVAAYAEKMKSAVALLDTLKVEYDLVYPEGRSYLGKDFKVLLSEQMDISDLPGDTYRLYFQCSDNYTTTMLLGDFLKKEPLLALRDLGATSGEFWDPIEQHGEIKDMSPAYLIWQNAIAENGSEFVWPYALVNVILARE